MSEKIKKHSKTAIVLGLILALVAMYGLIPLAKAGTVTSRKATLTDSRPSTVGDWEISFVTQSLVDDTDETIIIKIDDVGNAFDLTGITEDDIDIEDDGTDKTTAVDCAQAGNEHFGVGINTTTDEITLTCCSGDTGDIVIGSTVVIKIGKNAVDSGTGANQITNPAKSAAAGTADIYDVDVAGNFGDTGKMKVAIQDGVTVKATIAESLSFIIATVASGSCTGDTGAPAVISTTAADEVDFGAVAANAFKAACHELSVTTNAANGYVVTTQETTSLKYSSTLLDDTTCDGGTCSESVQDDWATNSANWGLGHSCTNVTGEGTDCNVVYTTPAGACAAAPCYRQFACVGADADCDPGGGSETAASFMSNNGPVDTNKCQIHYKISRGGTQTAGSYQNAIVYIATPTY